MKTKTIKTIEIQGHTSDSFGLDGFNAKGKKVMEYNGYVPDFLGNGDDIILKIDIETGTILNWDAVKAIQELNEINETEE